MATSSDERPALPPLPGRRGLWLGILAYRWAAYAWMVLLAIGAAEEFREPAVAWLVLGATGLWTLWLSVTPRMGPPADPVARPRRVHRSPPRVGHRHA